MQKLINGIDEAKRAGKIPDYHLIIWCIFEIAKEKPDCQRVSEEERKPRLEELGMDPCQLCECDKHMKGTGPVVEGSSRKPRLLSDVCKGRLFRSRGFLPYDDVVQKFKQNSRNTWEAQQECTEPETEYNYLQGYQEQRVGLREYMADPQNGTNLHVRGLGIRQPPRRQLVPAARGRSRGAGLLLRPDRHQGRVNRVLR